MSTASTCMPWEAMNAMRSAICLAWASYRASIWDRIWASICWRSSLSLSRRACDNTKGMLEQCKHLNINVRQVKQK
jgi:hypothetical protein